MKRHSLNKVTKCITLVLLLAQLAVGPLNLSSGGASVAHADNLTCNSGPIAAGRSFNVPARQSTTVSNDDASLAIDQNVLTATTVLTITPMRPEDVPALDQGMTNVTKGPRCGYRFGPHPAHFAAAMQVSIPYNRSLIPPGLTEQDIKTFYFDDQSGSWKELQRVAVDTQRQNIVSTTDHFTDMINATVTVPDHPQTLSNNPTSMKDIKAADPGAGINLIEPPTANNIGDARLSYPIEVPPGRGNMQPRVQVSYSSSGANGWMGVGWDIPIQAVTVDTRWGVPRYDTGQLVAGEPKETETYVLNGEELTPVFNRGELQDRAEERVFHTRVEGAFNKIVRHGDDPTNYWWEVTAKDGTRYFYGGDPETDGPRPDSTLRNGNLAATDVNIFKWALREVRDPNGNTMTYHYDVVDGGGGQNGEPWHQIYLRSTRYTGTTGTSGSEGPYEIVFNREGGRPDVAIDGRPGFETRLDQRLASIVVRQIGLTIPTIRKYVFQYRTGQFSKSLLNSVIQYGENGESGGIFNRHDFAYYDDIATGTSGVLEGFKPSTVSFDNATYVDGTDLLTGDHSTSLRADDTSSDQGGGSIGISALGLVGAGIGAGGVGSGTDTKLTLIDLNGDGLLDQLYEKPTASPGHPQCGKSFFFRPNIAGPSATPDFGPQVRLGSLEGLCASFDWFNRNVGHDTSATFNLDEHGNIGPIGGSHQNQWTDSSGEIYMSDVNGDGLPDLVVQKSVYFNQLQGGVPTFDDTSPTPLEVGTSNTDSINPPIPDDILDQMERVYHLVDPVRRWTAPSNGTVSITGQVHLLAAAPTSYTAADGVRVSVQKNGTELWTTTISNPRDLTARTITGQSAVQVSRGDNIYFRVNSRDDGRYDAVAFDPTITYTGVDTTKTDENAMPAYVFNASSDFAFGGLPLDTVAPITGTATLTGVFQKDDVTSDDVKLLITKYDGSTTSTIFQQAVNWDQTGSFPVTATLSTNPGDRVRVRIDADSRIDLTGIHFAPSLAYDTIMGQPAPTDENGNPAIVLSPTLSAQDFPQNLGANTASSPYQPWIVPSNLPTGTLQLRIQQSVSISNPSIPQTYTTNIALVVKGRDDSGDPSRLAKQRINVRNGAISGTNAISATIPVERGDVIYFEADATTPDSFDNVALSPLNLTIQTITTTISYPNIAYDRHAGIPVDEAFGGGFRGWWQGQYNGSDGNNATSPIDEADLRLPVDQDDDAIDFFVQMIPFPGDTQWRIQDEDCWIGPANMSATRLGRKNLSISTSFGGGQAIVRKGGSDNEGASLQVPIIGGSGASGSNWSQVDFLDFNGDGYPDVVGNGKLQPTLPNGALAGTSAVIPGCAAGPELCSRVRSSKSDSISVNVGGSVSRQLSNAQGELLGITINDPTFSINAGVVGSTGDFRAQSDLVDINGDGLPDLVRQGASGQGGLQVQLNLGYRFGAVEEWAQPSTECTALVPAGLPQLSPSPRAQLRCQKSVSVGATAGIGFGGKTPEFGFSLGAGASDSLSLSGTQQDLVDVNGDGLVDVVSKTLTLAPVDLQHPADTLRSTTPMRVKINTGSGFTGWYTYTGALDYAINTNASHSFSVGASAGVSIPMPFCLFLCSLDIGGNYSHAHSLGGFSTMLSDFDGDGYADHIYSDYNGNVSVSLNNHGRTNLLKSVQRPLGGSFTLDYTRTGDTTDQPGNRWALSKVSTFDGHDGDGDVTLSTGKVTQMTAISYEGGKYDRAEREFYGFRTVTTSLLNPQNSATYRSVVSTYKVDSYYNHGLLESQVTKDAAGHKFLETINSYDTATVDPGIGGGLQEFTATRFPRLIRAEQRFYEGQANPGKSTFVTYNYDGFGNVTGYTDSGDEGAQDDAAATITYSNCPAKYIMGVPTSIRVTGGTNNQVLRRREAEVNCTTGLVDNVKQYLDDDTFTQTDLTYFSNGNLESVTGPANATSQRYTLTYEYDDVVHSYVTGISDNMGYSSSAGYNFKFGQLESAIDLNNNQTNYTFDPFGRVETVRGPYEQSPGVPPTLRFSYHPDGDTPWALTRHFDPYRDSTGVDTIDTVLFTDGFKRVIQTKKDGTVFAGPDNSALDKTLVSGAVRFDFVGRTVKQFYPTTEAHDASLLGVFNQATDTVTPTLMTYDVIDRNTEIRLPDNTSTTTTYGFGEDRSQIDQFLTTVEDAKHNRVKTFQDVQGLVTSVEQFHGPDGGPKTPIWTSYSYNPMKELVEVKDAQQNITRMAYDNLGRRTSLDNPDTGRTDVTYDLASNMISKVTANLRAGQKQIVYGYDFNRLVSITYPDFPANNVTYAYGADGAPNNRAGRITRITDQSGSEEHFYGKLGELTREVKTINTNSGPATYITLYTYDTWGRMQNMTYPDSEVLTYTYDAGGQVKSASGVKSGRTYNYVSRMEYDKFEQRAFVQDGNGITTQYTYRPDNRRLSNLQAGQGNGNLFQNLGYSYDAVGNITSLVNDVPVAPPSQFGGPTTQTFIYDDLYRLTSANGTYRLSQNKTRQYSMNMQYDDINNILSKAQTDEMRQNNQVIPLQRTSYTFPYAYTGDQPHAPTHIDNRTFTYDANGNQTGWTADNNGQRRTIVWDEENRLQSLSDNGRTETYKYDAGGTRVVKRGPQGETVYVNPFFTMRNGQIGTKNVFMGNERVVSKLMKQDPQVEERDRYFYHPDHLGSSNYVTDANGQVYEHLEYFPFGETWVEEASNTQRAPYLFSSKELDEETGLYYYGARYYDPRTSAWQSPDPLLVSDPQEAVKLPLVLSAYTYANQNPLIYTDPDGRQTANGSQAPITLIQGPIREVKQPTLEMGEITMVNQPTLEMGEIREVKQPTLEMGEITVVNQPTLEMGEIREVKQPTLEMGEITVVNQPTVEVTMGPVSIEEPSRVEVTVGPVSIERHGPAGRGTMTGWSSLSSDGPATSANPSTGTRDSVLGRVLRSVQWPPR
jgi:RHS repeat-associated protein